MNNERTALSDGSNISTLFSVQVFLERPKREVIVGHRTGFMLFSAWSGSPQ